MTVLLMLLAMLTSDAAPARGGAIEANIRGTKQPLHVELLRRADEGEAWKEVAHQNLPAGTRRVRFDDLAPGIYQVLVQGAQKTEQLATKVVVGNTDTRRITIDVQPVELTGHITLGGVDLGVGTFRLRHREFHWIAPIPVAADGTFRATLWQQGAFSYTVRSATVPTGYTDTVDLAGSPIEFKADLPDARITGIVRDAKTGTPVANAVVLLQTNVDDSETHIRATTNASGKFDFLGIKYGKHTVRILSSAHLNPEPVVFDLDASSRLRELDVKLDPGRAIPVVVIDADSDPVEKATIFAVRNGRIASRATTDVDGRATVAVPAEASTLFIVPKQGGFAVQRVERDQTEGRVRVHLPRGASSLLIRARTTDGGNMPPFSLLMRYNGELVPSEVAEELQASQGLRLATGPQSEAKLDNIPAGSYEFWPYRTLQEAESIIAAGEFAAPIQVNVRTGENKIAVKFAAR